MMLRRSTSLSALVAVTALSAGLCWGRASASGIEAAPASVPNASSLATVATPPSPPHSREADEILAKAEEQFNKGRQLYFEGDLEGARRNFDLAVDTLLNASDSLVDHGRIERRLDEMCDLIYRFDIENLGAGQTEDEAVVFDKAPIDEISHMTFPVDENLAPKLKTELDQTASAIPLDLTDPVLAYVHFFSSDRGRQVLLSGFKRAGRYRPLIEKIFAEEGVPQELIYLAQAESGFLPRAISNKNAVGMWQFIRETGANYDLVHTSVFDERFDPEKATRAAAKYLKDLHSRYGDWYLAMAAYNCGAGAVDRAIERTGYADYWELLKRHALPRETANYVPIIVAMTIMAKNPKDYGLENVDTDAAVDYESIQLTASTNLNLVADATMQPVSVLRELNPSLLKTVAPSGFQIHVPKGTAESAEAALETVPAENRTAWRIHHVASGDTLATIAKSYRVTAERIAAVNRAADSLETGDVLLIPAVYHEESTPVRSRRRAAVRGHKISASLRSSKSSTLRHPARSAAALKRVSPQVLHRRAAVRTASLQQ